MTGNRAVKLLSPRQERVVNAMLVAPSKSAAAEVAGVHRCTVGRMLQTAAVSKELDSRRREQSDKAGLALREVRRLVGDLVKRIRDGGVPDGESWQALLVGLEKAAGINEKLLDIADRTGGSVEEELTWRDHEQARRRKYLMTARLLRWASRRPDKALTLAGQIDAAVKAKV